MRIDAYMQISQLYQATKPKKTGTTESAKNPTDTVEVSDFARELQIAKQAVNEAPDVRADKVNELKNAINSGTYDMSMDRLADKLVGRYFG